MPLTKVLMLMIGIWCMNANASSTQLITPIIGDNLQGVQEVPLNLSAIAAYSVQPKHLYVVDISQQVMPMRIEQPKQAVQQVSVPLQVYRWPEQTAFNSSAALNQLQLQLKQGEQQAVVTWPEQSTIALSQQGADQTWLLATPNLAKNLQAHALLLGWAGRDFASQVQVEGSNNLVDWYFAGLGQVLQTQTSSGQALLQQEVKISQPYAFWRIQFNQPIALQQASLQLSQNPGALWQQHEFKFQRTDKQVTSQPVKPASPVQWHLTLPMAIGIQKLQFDIPPEQLWQVQVQAKLRHEGRDIWQQIGRATLYAPLQAVDALKAPSNEIEFEDPISAREWRLNIDAPQSLAQQSQLTVQVFAPETTLYFLAQGVPPYRLIVDPQGLRAAPSLPQHLKVKGKATLGDTVVHTAPTSARQYGLWAGLFILVGILAYAAWRLYRNMQHMPQD